MSRGDSLWTSRQRRDARVAVPRRHVSCRQLGPDRLGPRARVFVRHERHRCDASGPMASPALRLDDRIDILGKRVLRGHRPVRIETRRPAQRQRDGHRLRPPSREHLLDVTRRIVRARCRRCSTVTAIARVAGGVNRPRRAHRAVVRSRRPATGRCVERKRRRSDVERQREIFRLKLAPAPADLVERAPDQRPDRRHALGQ